MREVAGCTLAEGPENRFVLFLDSAGTHRNDTTAASARCFYCHCRHCTPFTGGQQGTRRIVQNCEVASCQYPLTLLETMMQFGYFDSRSLYLFPLPRQKHKLSESRETLIQSETPPAFLRASSEVLKSTANALGG